VIAAIKENAFPVLESLSLHGNFVSRGFVLFQGEVRQSPADCVRLMKVAITTMRKTAVRKSAAATAAWAKDPVFQILQEQAFSRRVAILVGPPLAGRLMKMLQKKRLSMAELGLVSIERFMVNEITEARVAKRVTKRNAKKAKKSNTETHKTDNYLDLLQLSDEDGDE